MAPSAASTLHPDATAADVIEARFHAETRLRLQGEGKSVGEAEAQARQQGPAFVDALRGGGWDVARHLFDAGDWRYDWTKDRTV